MWSGRNSVDAAGCRAGQPRPELLWRSGGVHRTRLCRKPGQEFGISMLAAASVIGGFGSPIGLVVMVLPTRDHKVMGAQPPLADWPSPRGLVRRSRRLRTSFRHLRAPGQPPDSAGRSRTIRNDHVRRKIAAQDPAVDPGPEVELLEEPDPGVG
jgi:hypothetical protein